MHGSASAVTVSECEEINGKYVVAFGLGDRRMYAVADEAVKCGKAKIGIDLKKISLLKDGETVVSAMPEIIKLEGKLVKEKVAETVEVNGKEKKKKVIKFFYDVEGYKLPCPDTAATKLITAMGVKRAFTEKLYYECTPYDLSFAEDGIPAGVLNVLDYGKEKFAVCEAGGKTAYVLCEGAVADGAKLVPDVEKLSVIEATHNIRII